MKDSENYQYSGYTPNKQEAFRGVMLMHINLCQGIFQRNSKRVYYYIDLHPGPGYDPNGNAGSPLIFLELIGSSGLPYRAVFYEKDKSTFNQLLSHLQEYDESRVVVKNVDHHELVNVLDGKQRRHVYGMVYADPSNADVPFQVIRELVAVFPRMDVLINLACATYKRGCDREGYINLYEVLKSIKSKWLVRRPVGKHQWSMLIGSNWRAFPEWTKADYRDIETPEGRTYMEKLFYTHKELRKMYQLPLPLLENMPYQNYDEYLRHPRFRMVRAEALRLANGICQHCFERKATQVHHKQYPRWGEFDTVDNLLPVCYQCHCEIHGKDK